MIRIFQPIQGSVVVGDDLFRGQDAVVRGRVGVRCQNDLVAVSAPLQSHLTRGETFLFLEKRSKSISDFPMKSRLHQSFTQNIIPIPENSGYSGTTNSFQY